MKIFSWCLAFLEAAKRRRWLKKRRRYRVSWITYLNASWLYLRLYHRQILNVIIRPMASHWKRQLHGRQIQYNRRYHRAIRGYKKQHFNRMRRFSQQKTAVKPMKRGLLYRQRAKILEYPEKKYTRSRYIGFSYSRSKYIGFSYLRRGEEKSVPSWVEFHKKLFYRTDRIQCSMLTSLLLLIVYHQLLKKCEKFKLAGDSHDTPVIKPFTIEHPFDYPLGFWSDDSIFHRVVIEDLSNLRCNIENRMGYLSTYKNMRVTHMTSQSYLVPPRNEDLYKSIIFDQDLARSIARSSCEVLEEESANRWATTAMEIAGKELGDKFISWLENMVTGEFAGGISAYRHGAFDHVRSPIDSMILLEGLETYGLLLNDTSKFEKISKIVSYLEENDDSREEKRRKIQEIMGIDMNDIIDSKLDEIVDFKGDKITDSELMAGISDPLRREDEDNSLEGLFQKCMEIWKSYEQPGMTEVEMDRVVYGEREESNNFVMSEAGYEDWDNDHPSVFSISASGSQDNSNAVGSNISSYTEQSSSSSSISDTNKSSNLTESTQLSVNMTHH